jgi:hypothetical protein
MVPFGGTEEQVAIHHCSTNQHQISFFIYCLPYIRLPKMPSHYLVALKMATALFPEMLDNFQHLMQLIPESQSYTFNSCRENLTIRILLPSPELKLTTYL